VDLGYAQYSGIFNSTTETTQFLGIRFAASPTGALRWQPPHPPATTPGVQKAETQPATCFFGLTKASVYLPGQISQDKRLPVVVWIHGGGYVSGSASGFTGSDIQDGKDLIRAASNGVVVVVLQYRLGVFGFLPGKEV
ncbi:Alpha/Beta hydrolase protein, partial [Lyophyllum atratum]